jgi:hypothetical protein
MEKNPSEIIGSDLIVLNPRKEESLLFMHKMVRNQIERTFPSTKNPRIKALSDKEAAEDFRLQIYAHCQYVQYLIELLLKEQRLTRDSALRFIKPRLNRSLINEVFEKAWTQVRSINTDSDNQ